MDMDNLYEKIRHKFELDFFRSRRYNIPLTLLVMEIPEKSFLKKLRKSDNIIHLFDNLYMILLLFCNYDESMNSVKRLKRIHKELFQKDLHIFNITYEEGAPVPTKELLKNILHAYYEVEKKVKVENDTKREI